MVGGNDTRMRQASSFDRRRLTANIALLFPDLPFLDRIDAAADAGFDKVECHFPYDVDLAVLKARLEARHVAMTALNTAPGDLAAGEWGLAGVPGREEAFRRDFREALRYAEALETPMVHVMAGIVKPADREDALRTFRENLAWGAGQAAKVGVTLLLEPLNLRERPNYLVSRSDDVAAIIAEIGAPNIKILFDIYHLQIMEGDLTTRLRRHASLIGHVQLASVPDRTEPDRGEVDVRHILRILDEIHYRGLIGLEYKPSGDTQGGIGWIDEL
ncbi:hydroxypyruvate isomerase family protein [Aureimonas psammosilenae]|uniref:hydroxypyruvate isomerase family protein n=1 Tax=Aureimonas psammosilenae TaxID=2495496 RepID=UPI00126070A8|nr:TIM barrel protein [Aureimonas psammosilenae]